MTEVVPGTGDKLTRQHVTLIALLAGVVMFEGFDISATSVVLPYISREFKIPADAVGSALAIIALGSIVAWFLLRLADRYGRRPLLIMAAAGFSLGSLATIASTGLQSYTAIQFATRAALVTQMAMAYMILSESLPPRLRGRANGLLGATGSFGAALPFLAIGPALDSALGWRLLFVIGATPLLLMPLLLWKLRETPVWLAARSEGFVPASPRQEFRRLTAPDLRQSFIAMSALWVIINFTSAASALFFTLYVVNERGWPPGDFARIAPFGLVGAFVGYVGAGLLADWIGRRQTLCLFMGLLGALSICCYLSTNWYAIAASFIGLQAMLGVWVVAYTINSELFPTELRGAANGWCHNLIGRWGVVVAPILLGWMSTRLGSIGLAAAILGGVAWLTIPVILLLIPETRGQRLDRGRENGVAA